MNPYQYQVLRYLPDPVGEEFVNLGVVVFAPDAKEFDGRFLDRSSRLSAFFPGINGRFVVSTIKQVQKELDRLRVANGAELDYRAISGVDQLTALLVPPNDGALRFSPVKFSMDVDLNTACNALFDRLVAAYLHEDDKEIHNDKQVWTKVYKRYFEERQLAERFKEHTVRTAMDAIAFTHASKNDAWHCLEPANFKLKQKARVKEKVYKWTGKLSELSSTNEKLHIYFLSILPTDPKLKEFVKKQLGRHAKGRLKVEVVEESRAKATVDELAKVLH